MILSVGATPLLRAARAGDTPTVELLLAHGALVDLPSNEGVTPLMAAAGVEYGLRVTRGRNRTEEGVLETMQLLLDAGADIDARIGRGAAQRRRPYGASTSAARQGDYAFNRRGRQVPSRERRAASNWRCTAQPARVHVHRGVSGRERRRARRPRTRTAGRRSISRWQLQRGLPAQAAEPHVETAKVLEALIAARSTTSPVRALRP